MNATWLIAKYMDDVRRREPKNVGVILFTAIGPFSRFKGEKPDGEIDGRRINVGSLENYKAWVTHWKRTLREGGDRLRLLAAGGQGNYFLEIGGERVVGNEGMDPPAFLDQLYRELVENASEAATEVVLDPRRLIERTFEELHIRERIEEHPKVVHRTMGVEDPLTFDYRYRNGINVLMKRVHFRKEAWNEVLHAAAWTFHQAHLIEPDTKLVPLVSHAVGVDPGAPLKILEGVGIHQTVDVSDENRAAVELRSALGLKAIGAGN